MSKLFKTLPSNDDVEMNRKTMTKKISKKIIEFSTFERLYYFNEDLQYFCNKLFGSLISNTRPTSQDEITIDIEEDEDDYEEDDYEEEDEEPFRKFEEDYKKLKEEEEEKEFNMMKMYKYFFDYNFRQIQKMKTMDLFWLYYTITKKFKKMNLVDEEGGQEFPCMSFYFNSVNEICFVNPR